MTPEDLLGLYSEAFKSIVNSDIRGEVDEETANALRSPLVVRRWYTSLVATKKSIETQFATFKIEKAQKFAKDPDGYAAWIANKASWRAGALRFEASVEDKIAEAKQYLRREYHDVDIYRQAIALHRGKCLENPDQAEDWDEELWATID